MSYSIVDNRVTIGQLLNDRPKGTHHTDAGLDDEEGMKFDLNQFTERGSDKTINDDTRDRSTRSLRWDGSFPGLSEPVLVNVDERDEENHGDNHHHHHRHQHQHRSQLDGDLLPIWEFDRNVDEVLKYLRQQSP